MKKILIIICCITFLIACKKQDKWLDIKSNKSDVIPNTIEDYQAILNNTNIMNSYPALGIIGADHYYLTDAVAASSGNAAQRNAYIWATDIYEGAIGIASSDWSAPYTSCAYANIVLEGILKLQVNSQNLAEINNLKGSALFFRSYAFYGLLQHYAAAYDATTADLLPGIPLRISADVNIPYSRSTIREAYQMIITDLEKAITLLPSIPRYRTNPSKPAAMALLAKTYLVMKNYEMAEKFADDTLKEFGTLIDFSSINTTPTFTMPTFQTGNPEILFYSTTISYSQTTLANFLVDEEFFNSYSDQDLRKRVFYRVNADGTKNFRGRYTGGASMFAGLATNEVYLIKAECQIRNGKLSDGISTLNELLVKRWAKNSFSPVQIQTSQAGLDRVLLERNKELPFTSSVRWEDLRRLNTDPRYAITLKRTVNGVQYTLPPNDKRYVYPIVPQEIQLNNLTQNPR